MKRYTATLYREFCFRHVFGHLGGSSNRCIFIFLTESSQYSGGSSLSEGGSSRKRARLQQAVQQQQEQQRSQLLIDDLAPPRSPCSDASVNSHVSRGSMPQVRTLSSLFLLVSDVLVA